MARTLHDAKHLARVTKHHLTIFGESRLRGSAVKERAADRFFKPADLDADGRLSQTQALGSAGKASAFRHRYKSS